MATRLERRATQVMDEALGRSGDQPSRFWYRRERAFTGQAVPRLGPRWYPVLKAAADWLLALLLFVPGAPIILLSALLVKFSSRGPAFYTQTRLGKGGKPFKIIKLRTMIHHAESLTGPRWSLPGDPRITRIGAFLRATHLDELPQLFNVLRGEMSLIGPRPERPEFLPELEQEMPGYRQRLLVRPGVTGLAQVQLPSDSDVESVRRKLAFDLYYVSRFSLWLDLKLVICTLFHALRLPYATLRRWFGLPALEEVEQIMQPYLGDPTTKTTRQVRRAA